MNNSALCIGDGRDGSGCGFRGGRSGEVCPVCNGMLLSPAALEEAERVCKQWIEQDAKKNIS